MERDRVAPQPPNSETDSSARRLRAYLDHLEDLGYDLAGGGDTPHPTEEQPEPVAQGSS